MSDGTQNPRIDLVPVIVAQAGFVFFVYLAAYISRFDISFASQDFALVRLSGILALLGGIGLSAWLLFFKPVFYYRWTATILYVAAILLVEYWYFVKRLEELSIRS